VGGGGVDRDQQVQAADAGGQLVERDGRATRVRDVRPNHGHAKPVAHPREAVDPVGPERRGAGRGAVAGVALTDQADPKVCRPRQAACRREQVRHVARWVEGAAECHLRVDAIRFVRSGVACGGGVIGLDAIRVRAPCDEASGAAGHAHVDGPPVGPHRPGVPEQSDDVRRRAGGQVERDGR
jgi:hypothetical protein